MVREKYGVRLTPEQRDRLEHLVSAGKNSARVTTRARILLKTDDGWPGPQVAEALDVVEGTVYRTSGALPRLGWKGCCRTGPKPTGTGSWMTGAKPTPYPVRGRLWWPPGRGRGQALACSPAPEGHDHWTLRLLAGKVVELGLAPALSHKAVRRRLKKTCSSRVRSRNGASPR